MPHLFSNKITNVLLVCPYWRSGSSYLGGMFCKYNDLKNLDELLYDPKIDPTRDNKSASLENNLSYPSSTGKVSKEMIKFIADDEENLEIKKIQANALDFSNRSFFEKEKLFKDIEKYIN